MAHGIYGENNLFTFQCGWEPDGTYVEEQLSQPDTVTGYEQYDLGIVEIDDEGDLVHSDQLDQIMARIGEARTSSANGPIVVTFIHGWHNNAEWDNANLVSFRRLLRSLMTRELEELQRRVIGVYVGWNGTPNDGVGRWIGRLPGLKHATFKDRYETAGQVGKGHALGDALVGLTSACKAQVPGVIAAPLIVTGHSMGAYILQSAFRELLRNKQAPLLLPSNANDAVSLQTAKGDVLAPDLLLSLNSAAEAEVAKDICDLAKADEWTKEFSADQVAAYHPPVLISATSEADQATDWVWRVGHGLQKSSTDGHDSTLATHTFQRSSGTADCAPAGSTDFGQPWHCLHKDNATDPTPRFRIDMPDHDRSNGQELTHTAYELVPHEPDVPTPFWLFQVPGDIIKDHSDIFNFKAASLVLALIQLSGVLASAAGPTWADNFSEVPLGDSSLGS